MPISCRGIFEVRDTIAVFGIWDRSAGSYRGPCDNMSESHHQLLVEGFTIKGCCKLGLRLAYSLKGWLRVAIKCRAPRVVPTSRPGALLTGSMTAVIAHL